MKISIKTSVLIIILCLPGLAFSQSIIYSKHNLSLSSTVKAGSNSSQSTCEFCHTPHAIMPVSPAWSKGVPGKRYLMYDELSSTTSDISSDPSRQPDGSSIQCLSCHDGTIAPGFKATTLPPGSRAILGTDLTNDHPISFIYNSNLASRDGQLKYPPQHPATIDRNNKVQCTSCHDPHDDTFDHFLVTSSEYSDLCFKCHNRDYWSFSSHSISTASWNGSGPNPWKSETSYQNVAQNACASCHVMHNAGSHQRLLKSQLEEGNCLDCHNGNVASQAKNIELQFAKAYKHNIYAYDQVHNPKESPLVTLSNKHIECTDCHNPHAVNATASEAPFVKGFNIGVPGIDISGNAISEAQNEYEICFRCHSENPVTGPVTGRQVDQDNMRAKFSPSAVSFHPVASKGRNQNVPSLLPQYSENSMIYCSDCHSSNGKNAPGGPHGSIYPQILKYQYVKTDKNPESAFAYELCYSCHSRDHFNSDSGDKVQKEIHFRHVVTEQTPCNACHDPHGISDLQGNETNNSHLINFDLNIVEKGTGGGPKFFDNGYRTGNCTLICHGYEHNYVEY